MRRVERGAENGPEISQKVCGGNGRDERRYVGEGAVEGGDRAVVEVIAGCDRLYLGEGRVASADYGHSSCGELVTGVYRREPTAGSSGGRLVCACRYLWQKVSLVWEGNGVLQWLESTDDVGPGRRPIGFDVNEEVQRLCPVCIENAVVG